MAQHPDPMNLSTAQREVLAKIGTKKRTTHYVPIHRIPAWEHEQLQETMLAVMDAGK